MSDEKSKEKPRLQELLAQLTKDQLRFVVALQEHPTKDAAAKAIKIKPQTAYDWPDIVDEAARLLALDALESARELRKRNLIKAMGVKAAGLDSKSESVRQKAASEIIEWELGKAQLPVDVTTDGKAITPITVIEIVKNTNEPVPD